MYSLNCKGRLLTIDKPLVMGIINTTPDSFYSGSRVTENSELLFRVEKMIADGAVIIDVGGQSTRPGSFKLDKEEELKRVVPAIRAIHDRFPDQVISIDSFYASVVNEAVDAGASIVNDVSAGTMDEEVLSLVSKRKLPYVLMHMLGDPQHMQDNPVYNNVTTEVFDFFSFRLAELVKAGINDIIIDPGFGFGKTAAHNFTLLRNLSYFQQLDRPVMTGLSRKATIYKTLGVTAAEALNGTTVMHTMALMNGASILRVHDVKEAVEAVKLYLAYSA